MADFSKLLEELSFWSELTNGQKALVRENAYLETFEKGETVSHSGTDCKGTLLVLNGGLRAYILSDEGREVTIYRLHPKDVCALSASCLLKSIVFEVTIEAVEKTEVLVIPSAVFHALIDSNPAVELYLLRIVNQRFSDVMWTMQQILFMGADRRVAIFLYDEMEKSGSQIISMTHDEIARYIGSAREVVTRVLNYFAEEGVVVLHRGKTEIIDREKLKEYM